MASEWQKCKLLAAYYNGEPFVAPFRFSTLKSTRTKAGKYEASVVELCVWQRPNVVTGQRGKLEVAFEVADNVRTYTYPGCKVVLHGSGFYPVQEPEGMLVGGERVGYWIRFKHEQEKSHGH